MYLGLMVWTITVGLIFPNREEMKDSSVMEPGWYVTPAWVFDGGGRLRARTWISGL